MPAHVALLGRVRRDAGHRVLQVEVEAALCVEVQAAHDRVVVRAAR
jgi:hypothetical protein